ncbi:MAG: hypothetical protein ABEK01_03050 [Candidatus Nanohaloarchaea archaeon]
MRNEFKYIAALLFVIGTSTAVIVTQTSLLSSGTPAVSQVPSGVDYVAQVDMSVLQDKETKKLVNTALETAPSYQTSANSLQDALDKIENKSGIDPRDTEEVVAYGKIPDQTGSTSYFGLIAHADWSLDTLVESIRKETPQNLSERTYKGKTVYVAKSESVVQGQSGQSLWIAEIGTGEYAVGTEKAVKDAIDVSVGDSEPLSGELKAAYESTRDGYVRFASRIPESQVPSGSMGMGPDLSAFKNISYVSGAYYTDSNKVGINLNMETGGTESAKDVKDAIKGGISLLSTLASNEKAQETLDKVKVSRDGKQVTITYEDSVDRLVNLMQSQ